MGAQIATLSVTSESGSGSRPYAATVLPLRGEVPSGSHVSNAAGTEAGAILSTHDDGSAAVVVFASTASATGSVALHAATGTAPAALTAAAIVAQVSSVAIAFGSPYGTASISDFSTPERVWWATSKAYCARYRVAAPTPGSTALEAVIDIHAWSDRAYVETVIENGKFDATASTTSTKPAAATYVGATVSINGSVVATVNSADCAEGSHGAFRAWRAAGWVGGDPGLRVTQLHTELQDHPLLFKINETASYDMANYASDAYSPWGTGRHRATNMGGTGDDDTIGPLPQWEARALQSGDYRAWKATEASALAILSYNVNHRDSVTGRVPDSSIMPTKCQGSFWANWPRNTAEPAFEVAHQPSAGLMAFIARPSPVFIEIAQKIAVWTGTVDSTRDILGYFDEAAAGITDCTGIIGNTQIRSKAWGPRNIAHATFITPDAHPWRAGGLEWLDRNARYLNAYRVNTRGTLLPLYEGFPDASTDLESSMSGVQVSLWMYHFCVVEWAKIASSRLLAGISGARQTAVDTVADRLCDATVKWVTEQSNGGWRFLPYRSRIGDASSNMAAHTTWTAQRAFDLTGAPSAATGLFNGSSAGDETTWAAVEARGTETVALEDSTYCANFVAALGAAVERGVSGASTAWDTVTIGITNWTTWRGTFANSPKWGSYPRSGFGVPNDVVADVWTPTKDGSGNILAGSWANLTVNRWAKVSGTALSQISASVLALTGKTIGTLDLGNGNNICTTFNSWVGVAVDAANGKVYNVAGGGHADSSLNGVWRLDLERMGSGSGWVVDKLPSDPNDATFPFSAAYKAQGNYTNYTPIPGGETGYGGALNLYDVAPGDRPTSRHTYDGICFNSDTGTIMQTRTSRWDYDPSTQTFTRQKWNNGTSDDPVSINDSIIYHSGTGRYYGRFPTDATGQAAFGYVGAGRVITRITPSAPSSAGYQSLCAIGTDTALWLSDDRVNPNTRFGIVNMATGAFTGAAGAVSGSLTMDGEMPCAVWIPGTTTVIRRYDNGSSKVWRQVDISNTSAPVETAYTPAGNVPPSTVTLVGNKFFAYPARNVLVFLATLDDTSDAVYVMRYA